MLTTAFKNHFSTKIVLLLILGFSLSGCGLPIIVFDGEYMGHYADNTLAIFYSLVIYAIWLSVLVSIPLNIKGTFTTTPQRYRKYKLFWWIASLVHANLFLWFLGVVLAGQQSIEDKAFDFLFMIIITIIILLPTLLPTAYQYRKKSKQQGAE